MRRAIAVVCYNRPHYLATTVAGLLRNRPFLDACDVIAFQDAAEPRVCGENERELSRLPLSDLVVHEDGPHLERHLVHVRQHVFDTLGYDRMFLVEDDVVLGRHALRITDALLDWATRQHSGLGVATTWNLCRWMRGRKIASLRHVSLRPSAWFYYGQTRESWSRIAGHMRYYADEFLRGTFSELPVQNIHEWVRFLVRGDPAGRIARRIPSQSAAIRDTISMLAEDPQAAGQDAVTHAALLYTGQTKVATVVNRVAYIGEVGTHENPSELFDASLDEFEADATLSEFEWHEEQ